MGQHFDWEDLGPEYLLKDIIGKTLAQFEANVSDNGDLVITFPVPYISEEQNAKQMLRIPKKEGQKNILFFCSVWKKSIVFPNFKILFIDFSFDFPEVKEAFRNTSVSRSRISQYLVQSKDNLEIIFLLENDQFNVEVTNMINFLRDTLETSIPITAYFLNTQINDMFYVKMLVKKCHCITPFIRVSYGPNAPADLCIPIEIIKSLNDKEYETEDDLEEPKFLPLEFFSDLSFNMSFDLSCRAFHAILYNLSEMVENVGVMKILEDVFEAMKEELEDKEDYQILLSKLEESTPLFSNKPSVDFFYFLSTENISPYFLSQEKHVYQFFLRLIVLLMMNSGEMLSREDRKSVAQNILISLEKYLRGVTILVEVKNKEEDMDVRDAFRHYRKNKL